MKFGHIFLGPLPSEIWRPKTSNIRRYFAQLRDLIANVSGMQKDIVNRKTALQTTDTPAQANYLVYFGPQTAKNGTRSSDPPTDHSSEDWRNKSVAFARWQQRAAIRLGTAAHLVEF